MPEKKPLTKIPYGRQYIDKKDILEVSKALASDWLTQGPKVKEFEKMLAEYTGAKYCVCVSNGTAALHLVMLAIGVGQDDKVLTSPITFSASANCAVYVNAEPDFVDIESITCQMDPKKLDAYLSNDKRRKNVKAVIPVHFMGTVAKIEEIKKICSKYDIKVIEDAAHALGAEYKTRGKWIGVGSCKHSDAAITSFHPIKHITTGEGGAILTNDKKLYEKLLRLRHHGIDKNRKKASSSLRKYSDKGWFYDLPEVGFNYRINDFQCALGISQLKKLDGFVRKRRKLVARYNNAFEDIKDIQLPYENSFSCGSYHIYVIRVSSEKRDELYDYLKKKNIFTQVNYIPVHLFSYYQKRFGYKYGDFPVSEKYFEECLSLPLYPSLTLKEQDTVVKEIVNFFKKQ